MSIDRIAALLAKAERTDIAAEAEAYLAKAQALATAASIDLALARSRITAKQARPEPVSRTVTIGEKGKRANRHLVALFIAVAHANDVQVDIAANSTYVIAYGMADDQDAVGALFASLAVQMTASGQRWIALGRWREETYVASTRRGGITRRTSRPHTAQTARVAFYRSYVQRIGERLQQARDEAVAAAVADPAQGTSTSLVLRDKTAEIRDFHRRESKARGTWRGYSGGMRHDHGTSTSAGRQAASSARLADAPELPGKRAVEGGQ